MTSSETYPTLPRLDAITGLRWWAAFGVFFFHIRNLIPLPGPLAALAPLGNYGVTFFFVLSGFVLTWSWRAQTDKRTFYWRRFARIYPLSLVTLVMALPVFYTFDPASAPEWVKPVNVGVLLLCLVLLQGWSRNPDILFAGNPAAWTLTVEAFFYTMHPFVTMVLRRLSLIGALIAAGGVVVFAVTTRVAVIAFPDSWLTLVPWPVMRLNEFVLGMCVAWAFRKGWVPRIPLAVPLGLLLVWFAIIVLSPRVPDLVGVYQFMAPYGNEVATVLLALLIVSVASLDMRGRTRLMRIRPIVALGEWSYAFYLIHATFIYAVIRLWGTQPGGWAGVPWFVGLLALSIVVAWFLHVSVERPMERRLRAWQTERRTRVGTAG
jgi:peptidoglycan/LPS O-acetylase OafA/YrhL